MADDITGSDRMRWFRNGITAHRGNSLMHPENTLAAFDDGLRCGADWIELDVRLTRDDQLVVIHDDTTGRTACTDVPVAGASLRELRLLDMGGAFRRHHPSGTVSPEPYPIPLLGEVLELARHHGLARVSIQPKVDCVQQVVGMVRALRAEDWVGFNDGSIAKMAEARALMQTVPIFLDTGPGGRPLGESVEIALSHRFDAIVMHRSDVSTESVIQVKRARLHVGAWTVNELSEAQRFDALGVERFYTDAPVSLLAGLGRNPLERAATE